MKNKVILCWPTVILIALLLHSASAKGQFSYLNPLPGSKYHNRETTLAVRNGSFIDPSTIQKNDWIEIIGSHSGTHQYTTRLSDDRKTIVVKPIPGFDYGETVMVNIYSSLRKETGEMIEGTSFSFDIRNELNLEQSQKIRKARHESLLEYFGYDPTETGSIRDVCNLDSLPTYMITTNNNPSPGQIFYCNNNVNNFSNSHSFPAIIENDGTVKWACDFDDAGGDFKINYNGYLTYFNPDNYHWMIMDSAFHVIDSVTCGNGYEEETNLHDFSYYSDGHSLLFAADIQIMDMTPYGGQPDASVETVIIQELDENKDVIFEWSGWDHFQITDAAASYNLTLSYVDYVHPNALSRDNDGNFLLSCRHMNECTKIDHETGDIIWRLGGENNQFTFINDNIPQHFSYQHDVRRIANGNITLFNNGNHLPVEISSAKEYQLDEVNKTATLIWYYEHPDVNGSHVYGNTTGSVQRLSNGNTLIDWGTEANSYNIPNFTEVDSSGNIVWEMHFDEDGQKSYRAHKYIWEPCNLIDPSSLIADNITDTSATLSWSNHSKISSFILEYKKCSETTWIQIPLTATNYELTSLQSATCYEWRVVTVCEVFNDSASSAVQTFTTDLGVPVPFTMEPISEWELFPNPASGKATINLTLSVSHTVEVSVTNLLGVTVISYLTNAVSGKNKIPLDLQTLPSGSYLIELKTESQIVRKKIVVN